VSRDDRFDMVVIGSGPAGAKAAAQGAYFGNRVAIVERSPSPGGAGVSGAGIPTKTLRETALYITGFRRREVYGVSLTLDPAATVAQLRGRTEQVVGTMTDAVRRNIERHGIRFVRGEARLGADRTVHVTGDASNERLLQGNVVLIATGSRPFHPPAIPFDDPDVYDSQTVFEIDHPFSSLVVVGGGAVGCEYASIFTALGVGVTLVDAGERLLPFLDQEISELLAESFRGMGMRLLLGSGRAAVARDDRGLKVRLASGEELRPDKVLFASGRAGNTDGLGLGEVGVEVDQRNRIVIDDTYRTTAAGIYAAGDVIGAPGLASVSMEQGRVAACYALGIPFKETVDPMPPFGRAPPRWDHRLLHPHHLQPPDPERRIQVRRVRRSAAAPGPPVNMRQGRLRPLIEPGPGTGDLSSDHRRPSVLTTGSPEGLWLRSDRPWRSLP
jgi:NAD(P) transhydrogenase